MGSLKVMDVPRLVTERDKRASIERKSLLSVPLEGVEFAGWCAEESDLEKLPLDVVRALTVLLGWRGRTQFFVKYAADMGFA